jgi:glycosyltransferase involved in cell wall biosynthesis
VRRGGDETHEAATAIIPARNEAEVIDAAIEGLLSQRPLVRIVAVDDGSTDGTKEKLASSAARAGGRLVILESPGPSRGECGKPAALVYAVEHASIEGDWLVFVDADVVLKEGAIAALFRAQREAGADLVSIVPEVRMESAIEQLVMPAIGALVLAQYAPADVADPHKRVAFANGQLILVRRSVYERAGGHRAVIGEILEDVRLAERIKAVGGRIVIVNARDIAQTRMYAGWGEILEGWSKNLYLLLGSKLPRTLGWLVLYNALAFSGWALLVACPWQLGLAAYALILIMQMILRGLGGASPLWAVLSPVSSLLLSRILLRSIRLHRGRKPIPWKGRVY